MSHVSPRDELAAVDDLINERRVAGLLLAFRMFGNTSTAGRVPSLGSDIAGCHFVASRAAVSVHGPSR